YDDVCRRGFDTDGGWGARVLSAGTACDTRRSADCAQVRIIGLGALVLGLGSWIGAQVQRPKTKDQSPKSKDQSQRPKRLMLKDIRYGFRSLAKHPGFTALAVMILALSIAATTSIFSVVNGVLLRPLGFPEPERLMVINEVNPQQGPEPFELAYLNWLDVRQQSKSFEEVAGVTFSSYILDIQGEPSRVDVTGVSANLFPMLRAQAAQGRTFLPEEEKPGANRVVIVSDRFWRRHFPNQSLDGQGINLDNRGYQVVGVMPATFQFPDDRMDVWMPFGPDSAAPFFQNRAVHVVFGLGRLKPGVAQSDATNELNAIFSGIQQQHPKEDDGHVVTLTSLHERLTGNINPALYVLLGAVVFLLLIGCANVANLQLVR